MSVMHQADGSGQIDIGGASWPISYQILSEDETDGTTNVHVELSAPRDWLLARGFASEAKLIRENGATIDIRSPGTVRTSDPIAIHLRSDVTRLQSEKEVSEQFPELTTR